MANQKKLAPLTEAAVALDAELERFHALCEAVQRARLNSGKAIDKAADTVNEVVASQTKVAEHLKALVAAVNAERDKQEKSATAVQARADELKVRREKQGALQIRFATLGAEARDVNELMQKTAAMGKAELAGDKENTRRIVEQLGVVHEQMGKVVDGAGELLAAAEADDFEDIARQADSLQKQTHAARNKLALLRDKLSQN